MITLVNVILLTKVNYERQRSKKALQVQNKTRTAQKNGLFRSHFVEVGEVGDSTKNTVSSSGFD